MTTSPDEQFMGEALDEARRSLEKDEFPVGALGRAVYAAEALVDGGTNLADVWRPPNGHPVEGKPYTIPEVVGGVAREASLALIAEWTERDPRQRSWAAAYLSETAP